MRLFLSATCVVVVLGMVSPVHANKSKWDYLLLLSPNPTSIQIGQGVNDTVDAALGDLITSLGGPTQTVAWQWDFDNNLAADVQIDAPGLGNPEGTYVSWETHEIKLSPFPMPPGIWFDASDPTLGIQVASVDAASALLEPAISVMYNNPGQYSLGIRAQDSSGAWSPWSVASVQITPEPATIAALLCGLGVPVLGGLRLGRRR